MARYQRLLGLGAIPILTSKTAPLQVVAAPTIPLAPAPVVHEVAYAEPPAPFSTIAKYAAPIPAMPVDSDVQPALINAPKPETAIDKDTGQLIDLKTSEPIKTASTVAPSMFRLPSQTSSDVVIDKDTGMLIDKTTLRPVAEKALVLATEREVYPFVGGELHPVQPAPLAPSAPLWQGAIPELSCPDGCWADWLSNSCVCPDFSAPVPVEEPIPGTAPTAIQSVVQRAEGLPWWAWALMIGGLGYLGYKVYGKRGARVQNPKGISKAAVSRGFDHGNYAGAYETEDYEQSLKSLTGKPKSFKIGHLLGFFSSYELYEIPDEYQDEVAYWRSQFPEYD